MTHVELRGVVIPGMGRGAALLDDERVLGRIERVFGLRVVPGTLNVRLDAPFDPSIAPRHVAASDIDPDWEAMTAQAGYHVVPVLVAGRHRGVAFQADEPGYPEDLLEIMCEVHLRSTLDLQDGDAITITAMSDVQAGSRRSGNRLGAALGSLAFLLLAPGIVAGVVPWSITRWRSGDSPWPLMALGFALIAAGVLVLLSAFVRFVTEGFGTPAPVAPTRHLVVGGLYRYVRNPMYLAVLAIIVGQAIALWRPILFGYSAAIAFAFVAFVTGYEEPTLRTTFGEEYEAYRRAVPGWWPRLHPWTPD